MNTNLVSVRNLKVAAAVLGMLGVGSILHAEENGSAGMDREIVPPKYSELMRSNATALWWPLA